MRKSKPFQFICHMEDRAECKARFMEAYQIMAQQYQGQQGAAGTSDNTES